MKLRILPGLLACLLLGTALAADKPVDVRDLMSATQFNAAGLEKLTPDEMAILNAWLAANAHLVVPAAAPLAGATPSVGPTAAPSAASITSFGKEMLSGELRGEPLRIESNIVGKFTGWNGNTTFKLANGQVWQQTDSTTYEANLQDPSVVIKRLGLGYLLTLTGHGATVFVRRIQ